MPMGKTVMKVCNIITTVIMGIVVVLAILLAGVRLVGLAPYVVLSGSMEPTYHVGSVIYVKDIEPEDLKVKDAITYTIDGGTVVTHRIIEVLHDEGNPENLSFRTKGDANKDEDGTPVPADRIIGKPVFTIPYLGYLANMIQRPQGIIMAAGICIIPLLMTQIVSSIISLKKDEESSKTS